MKTAANDNALAPWTPRAWVEHIREYHPHQAANSFAKHAAEFPRALREAFAIITAQVMVSRPYNAAGACFDLHSALSHLQDRRTARAA